MYTVIIFNDLTESEHKLVSRTLNPEWYYSGIWRLIGSVMNVGGLREHH